jgi:hypothetical protein
MAYEHELDAWRQDVYRMTESEREINGDAHRAAIGLVGEAEDDQ